MHDSVKLHDAATARGKAGLGCGCSLQLRGRFDIVCRDASGKVIWQDLIHNTVVDVGKDAILDDGVSSQTWYVGLTDGTPTVAAGDTMASHSGWTEVTDYSESTRPAWGEGASSGQSVTNATAVDFSINAGSTTVGGAFITSDSTKGGSSGTLLAAGAFTGGDVTLSSGSTLSVTYTISA